MAEGDDMSAAGGMFLSEQMDIMVQSLLTVIGTGVESDTGVERMQTLARAFHEEANTLHGRLTRVTPGPLQGHD